MNRMQVELEEMSHVEMKHMEEVLHMEVEHMDQKEVLCAYGGGAYGGGVYGGTRKED